MKDLTKLTDTAPGISQGGRADYYARTHGLKAKNSKDIVGGADNGTDQFAILRKYRIKGFEYGNYVSNNDRYDHLIACQKALEHLSKIIGSDNLGINAHIGIAFGARGLGGRTRAHYEPGRNMINLSKPSGAGCLAHEYGHALDYNFGSFVDQHKQYAALSGGQSVALALTDNTGGQLRAMMNTIVDKVKRTPSYKELITEVDCEYWHRRTEVFARFFEQYICYKMRKIGSDKYLTNTWEYYLKSAYYLRESEFMDILPDADRLMQEMGKFLNGNGQLRATPYPAIATAKKAAAATKPEAKPVSNPEPKAKKAPKSAKGTPTINAFKRSAKYTFSNGDYRGRSAAKEMVKTIDALEAKYDKTKDRELRKDLRKQIKTAKDAATKRNIAELSDLTGLSKPLIEALYRTVSDDDLRPVMNCIFFDPSGFAVTTDMHILCVVKCKVPAAISGRVITKQGTEIQGRFPNWEAVIRRQTPFLRLFRPADNAAILKKTDYSEAEIAALRAARLDNSLDYGPALCRLGLSWLKTENLAKVSQVLTLVGADTFQVFEKEADQATILQVPGKATALVMPILKGGLEETAISKYIPLLK